MEILRSILAGVVGGVLSPFSGMHAMLTLIPLSILVGVGMLWIFGRTSNQEAIRRAKNRLQAHLYEMRLFTDEPMLIWKAQGGLLAANARYIGLMLVPALVASIPMILIFAQLECFYGYTPLAAGRDAIVTVQMKDGVDGPAPELHAPEGVAVESPAIRAQAAGQISWRIRAERPVAGQLQLVFPDRTVQKSILVGSGPRYVSERRVSSLLDLIWYPGESRLPTGAVDWVEIRYPPATVHGLGVDLHWLIWLLVVSMISALVFKRSMKVSF
jgi:uncharacterized membrane protein (DUF106 family)